MWERKDGSTGDFFRYKSNIRGRVSSVRSTSSPTPSPRVWSGVRHTSFLRRTLSRTSGRERSLHDSYGRRDRQSREGRGVRPGPGVGGPGGSVDLSPSPVVRPYPLSLK